LHSRGQGFDSLILHENGDGRTERAETGKRQSAKSGAQSEKAENRRTETGDGRKKKRKEKAEAKS
jgi:hypothetical protein